MASAPANRPHANQASRIPPHSPSCKRCARATHSTNHLRPCNNSVQNRLHSRRLRIFEPFSRLNSSHHLIPSLVLRQRPTRPAPQSLLYKHFTAVRFHPSSTTPLPTNSTHISTNTRHAPLLRS